jgi:AcrR family transcriptional regulator
MNAVIDQQDIKREKILDAAYQRFLHFGYSKTTMNEIAGDLSLSKALLYYYFPDKSQLYIAVMQKIADDYVEQLESKVNTFCDIKEAFVYQINSRHDFILKNYNFFDFFRINEQSLPDSVWGIISKVHKMELDLLVKSLKSEDCKEKIKSFDDPCQIASLLLDALQGVSISAGGSHKKAIFHDKEHLDEIHKKRLLLADIFIRGLKN